MRRPELLAKSRRVVVDARTLLQLFIVWMEAKGALDQHGLLLDVLRIRQAALDRADGLAGLMVVKANALRTELRIDHVDLVAFADRFVRALGLACSAVDAI